jgi:hypothetical protein
MEGLHHYKFLYQRFLMSTLGWPEAAQMGYLKLLNVQFERGGIPADIKEIAAISPSAKKYWKKIAPKFKFVNEDGSLYNPVMAEIRQDAIEAYLASVENGKKGGRPKNPKNNLGVIEGVNQTLNPPGSLQGNPSTNENPATETPKESQSVNTRADLLGSNLYRQPKVPTLGDVKRVFAQQGGTDEMATRFFNSNSATGWFLKGSPITNFSNLVPGYIANWNEREGNSSTEPVKRMVL